MCCHDLSENNCIFVRIWSRISPPTKGAFTSPVQIEVPKFLTTFFKISTAAKGMAWKPDAAFRLKEYREALKVKPYSLVPM